MGDCPGGGDEVAEAHALVRRRPLVIDANVAWTVLHRRDAQYFLDNVSVSDISEPAIRPHDCGLTRRQRLTFRECLNQGMIGWALHRQLVPALLRAVRGDLKRAIKGGMLLPDGREQTLKVGLDGCDRLPRHGAELQREFTLSRRASGRTLEVIVLLVHDVECVGRKTSQLPMRFERHPAVGLDWG